MSIYLHNYKVKKRTFHRRSDKIDHRSDSNIYIFNYKKKG